MASPMEIGAQLAVKEREIPAGFNNLYRDLDNLEDIAARMEERLVHVVRSAPPDVPTNPTHSINDRLPIGPETHVGSELHGLHLRVLNVVHRMESLLSRLEL